LEQLDLSNNQIETVPITVNRLKKLRNLNLQNNLLTNLPIDIYETNNLKSINVKGNAIERLPPGMCKAWYNGAFNVITDKSYSELCGTDTLVNFDRSYLPSYDALNAISRLSTEDKKHVRILNLNSTGLSDVEEIDPIFEFPNLEELHINNNGIDDLTSLLKSLNKLKVLDASDNSLEDISYSFGNLKNLEFLDLSINRIEKIPASIGKLKSLRHLDLRNNEIDYVPPIIGDLKNLSHLELRDNPIVRLPANLCRRWQNEIIEIEADRYYSELCEQ
jgi:Leucine-rich repeat (LRR) protein